jgi:uncharacterized protein (TIGR03437 family)
MASFIPRGRFASLSVFLLLILFSSHLSAQQPTCTFSSTPVTVHSEGLAEPVGNLTATCTGGTVGSTVSLSLYISLNTNITNRLDANSLPTGIAVTGASVGSFSLTSPTTLVFNAVNYTVTAAPTTLTLSGIVAAVAPLATSSSPAIVTATVAGVGAQIAFGQTLQLAISAPTLLSSLVNNGVPCNGSPLPSTLDFPTFASTSISSELRITEASPAAFTPKTANADTGLRIMVNLAGYGSGTRVFVPDALVGNSGTAPTAAGAFASVPNGGTYTPNSNQLLLIRVNGADATGAGGTLAFSKPTAVTSFTSVTEIALTSGAASVVYEVVDSNPGVQESAHVPVFVVVPQTTCPTTLTPTLTAELAPVSHVSTGTVTDPIPRFVPVVPALDCSVLSDCMSPYFPNLTVNTTALNLTGSSLGAPQSAYVAVGNTGSGMLNFTTSVAYPSGSPTGWLSVSPSTGVNSVSLQVIASPASLQPGTYTATVTVSAAPYGMGTIPVTFTVGQVGVTIQNVGNAASFQYGTVAPGSYAVIFGLNLSGSNLSVTFNGLAGTVTYSGATQINVIVPSALAGQANASVLVTTGGQVSNAFKVALASNSPGIFTPGVINVSNGSVNSATNPATRGSYISVYLTGLATPVSNVSVNLAGQTGLVPQYAGSSVQGFDQVNVLIPASLTTPPNSVPLQVCVGSSCSNQITVYIQ